MSDYNATVDDGQSRPPASITGVGGIFYAYSIDWLSYSFRTPGLQFLDGCPQGVVGVEHELFAFVGPSIRPLPGYTDAREMSAGRVDWHHSDLKQGGLVTFTGADLALMRSADIDLLELVSHALYVLDGNITRLDFAGDCFLPGVAVGDIEQAYLDGRLSTLANKVKPVIDYEGPERRVTGRGLYLGSRSSGRMLRIYDKALSEGVPGPWVRAELETKGPHAVALAKSILLENDMIKVGKAAMREFVQVVGVPWFSGLLDGDTGVYLEPRERKPTNRDAWIDTQVIPALRYELLAGNKPLRFKLQGLLDDSEHIMQHGPFIPPKPLKNSPKAAAGLQVLDSLGLGGLRKALELAGKDECVRVLELLGYTWDTKGQKWGKGGE